MNENTDFDWIDDDTTPASSASDQAIAAQQFMHGMLKSCSETDEHREGRIARVLDRFDDQVTVNQPASFRHQRGRWITLSTAAIVLICMSVWMGVQPNEVQAAWARTLATLDQNVTRVYEVTLEGRRRRMTFTRQAVLTTHSSNEFVVSMPTLPVQPALIGSDGNEQWILFGDQNWRSSDDDVGQPREMFLNLVTARQMNFNRLLTELPDNYEVEVLSLEPIPGCESIETKPLYAKLKIPDPRRPRTIKLWPHPRTGVVLRMELTMPPVRGIQGIERIIAEFADEIPYLSETFQQESYIDSAERR
ncbi:MAG: hypothetical protein ACK5PB_00080 [Pirellula sp.]|jgi:hypothetical protein